MDIIMSILICCISHVNFDYKENGGNALLVNQKHECHVSQRDEHDCSAHNKKNGDSCEYPSLTHFTNEFWLKGKWWEEKLFFQIQNDEYHVSQWGEHDCRAHNQKNGFYYEYPSLTHFTDELWL